MTERTEDLRRHRRVAVDVQANARTEDGRKLLARTRDLSRSGICLLTTDALVPGDKLGVDLILLLGTSSTSEPLPLRARVVWCTPISGAYQVGAMFEGLSKKEASFLEMFLRYLDGTILPMGAEMEAVEEGDDPLTPPPDIDNDPFRG